jgi:cyclopropane fatty-acyl-phospholipid synthase-like methyltransferase
MLAVGDPAREDPEQSVLAIAQRAGVEPGDHILDAGCGVAGPAIVIADHYMDVTIAGLTISRQQAAVARKRIGWAGLTSRIRVVVADYQRLPFGPDHFDHVLFLESTGYAHDLNAVYNEAYRVLRPHGRVYVKDVFSQTGPLSNHDLAQLAAFDRLWGCQRSKTMDESVEAIGRAGFGVKRAGPLQAGTRRLLGSMFELDGAGGITLTELGAAFWQVGLNPPIMFGEIRAIKPSP